MILFILSAASAFCGAVFLVVCVVAMLRVLLDPPTTVVGAVRDAEDALDLAENIKRQRRKA